jgi:uncharacterized protein
MLSLGRRVGLGKYTGLSHDRTKAQLMDPTDIALLSGLIFSAALLYTSVGHAGASGYIAAMALFGLAPAVMKPTALALNILVAGFATLSWTKNGRDLEWRALIPLVAASVPAAFVGGAVQLNDQTYRILIGLMLLAASLKFIGRPQSTTPEPESPARIPLVLGLATGAGVGLLSGLTGTGGGIFLSPILLMAGWASTRQASALVAPFILANSIAGLLGNASALQFLPSELKWFVPAALLGAFVGTRIGTRWVSSRTLQQLLGAVLLIAAAKFLFT